MKIKRSNKLKNRFLTTRSAIIVAALVLLIGGVGLVYALNSDTEPETTNPIVEEDEDSINLDPATEEDQAAAEQNKQDIVESQEDEHTGHSGGQKTVTPVITFAGVRNGNVEVRSYVSEVYESTGKCTVTFTNGSSTVARAVEGIKDATYTRCDRVLVEKSEFSGSGWSVVVEYQSSTASGKSDSREVSGL